jgi:hypothetical protein
MFCNPQLTTCVLFCLRERESLVNFGRPRCLARNLQNPPAQKKRGRTARALPDCPPATSHSVQDAAKKIHPAHALAAQNGTPARESQRRTPALPRGRSVAATAEATPSVEVPPTQSVSNPKQFCLPGSLAPFALSEYTDPSARASPSPPQVSQTTCPPTKSVSDPKRVCQPGSFAPPPPTT